MKLVAISDCFACPRARYMHNLGHLISEDDAHHGAYGDRSRVYVGCGATDPPRPFDYGSGVFSPMGIPDWCPLPEAEMKIE